MTGIPGVLKIHAHLINPQQQKKILFDGIQLIRVALKFPFTIFHSMRNKIGERTSNGQQLQTLLARQVWI